MYFFFSVFVYLNVYFIFTFICSIYYSIEENTSRERWNNIIMAEFIIFKIIDLTILGFYDLFDNSDIFNTSLAITVEKLIWMIIETIIYSSKPNIKYLVDVQFILTGIIFIPTLVFTCFIGNKIKNIGQV